MALNEYAIQGLDEVLAKLEGLKYETRFKGGRFALRRAAQLVTNAAKENAERLDDPASPEKIADNIALRWNGRRYKATGELAFRIGVLGGARQYADTKKNVRAGKAGQAYVTDGDKGNPGGDTFYWRFLEFGTATSAAKPFMRPALENNVDAAIDEFVKQYGLAIDRALKRSKKTGVAI